MRNFLMIFFMVMLFSSSCSVSTEVDDTPYPMPVDIVETTSQVMEYAPGPVMLPLSEDLVEDEITVSDEDVELIALLTMAEAEGECEEGQRLVIDTVLNRVDNPNFPDNIHDVIYQRNQYSGIQPPRVNRCWVKEELVQLVREELANRSDCDVIFFRTKHYGKYGVPMFQIGVHYFSSYD